MEAPEQHAPEGGTRRLRSLSSRIAFALAGVVCAYALADHLVQRRILLPSFERLELQQAERSAERALAALEAEVDQLGERCAAWARDPALVDLTDSHAPAAVVARELGPAVVEREGLDVLALVRTDGRVVAHSALGDDGEPGLQLHWLPSESLSPTHPLLAPLAPREPVRGVQVTEHGPLLLASHPVGGGPESGPRARLVIGRFLSGDVEAELTRYAGVQAVDAWALDGGLPDDLDRRVVDLATGSAEPVTLAGDDGRLLGFVTVADVSERPALLLRTTEARSITAGGGAALRYALWSTIAAGLLLLLVLLRLLGALVLRPVARLTAHAVEIGRSDDSSRRLNMHRDDEIGQLADEFDAMLGELEASRRKVVEVAREAGMSEIATGILHNVGNVLNSVVVGTSLVGDRLRGSRGAHLDKLVQLLRENEADLPTFLQEDPKGRQIVPFLAALSRELRDEREQVLAEVESLEHGLEHIGQLVASQQTFARRSEVRESTVLSEQLDAALKLTAEAGGYDRIEVVRDFDSVDARQVDRHKLLQVLVNLVQNARQSLQTCGRDDARLVLRIASLSEGRVRIEVRDNGIGIPQPNLERVFAHGFTTRPGGHGFGLHSAANAVTELGGRLWAESDGPGQGASFFIELPAPVARAA